MTETEPTETPHIELGAQQIEGGKHWAIWPKTIQDVFFEPYCSGVWRVLGSAGSFTIKHSVLWIPCSAVDLASRYAPVIVSTSVKATIDQLVTDFNAHHAELAKKRAEEEKAKSEIDPETTRLIMDMLEFGRRTTATACRNCPGREGPNDG